MKYKNDHLKNIKEEYENNFDDYRQVDEEEMEKYINNKLVELPVHQLLQQLSLKDLGWDFDGVSFYPSAMSDEKSICPRTESGYGFTPDMNDEHVKKFNEIYW